MKYKSLDKNGIKMAKISLIDGGLNLFAEDEIKDNELVTATNVEFRNGRLLARRGIFAEKTNVLDCKMVAGAKNFDYEQAVAGLKAYCPSDNYGSMVISKIKEFGFDKYDEVLKNGGAAAIDLTGYKKLTAISNSNKAVNSKVNSKGIENVKDYHPTSGKVTEDAMDWAKKIAADDAYGYSQASRWGETKQYDCSSFVISAYKEAGIPFAAIPEPFRDR